MSETPQSNPDYPDAIQDVEKARFVAQAEKVYRDQAINLRSEAVDGFTQRIEKDQQTGKEEIRPSRMGTHSQTMQELERASDTLKSAVRLNEKAVEIGRVASEIYDLKNQ